MWCPGWDPETARGPWVKTKEFWIKYGLWLRIMGHSQFISCDKWAMVMFLFFLLLLLTQSCPILCDPIESSTPGIPVLHHLPKLAQTQVHWDSDAIQSSHPLSVVPFSSCFQPSKGPASGPFLMSQLFASGGQSIGVSASASVLPMNIQDWFPLGLTRLISLQSKGLSRV